MEDELAERVAYFNADYRAVTGKPVKHFFCPILNRDEDSQLCKGHVTNDALGSQGIWVPQVAAVDNFFGWAVEADLVAVLQDRKSAAVEFLTDPKKKRQHSPQIRYDGKPIAYYFPRPNAQPVPGHVYGQIVGPGILNDFAVVLPGANLEKLHEKKFEIVIEKDYRPQASATVLKAAHLTMFRMLGYRYVISPTGVYLASILRDFYISNQGLKKREIQESTAKFFLKFANMAMPMAMSDDSIGGTAIDNRVLLCIGSSKRMFAMCVIVQAGEDRFGVFLPLEDESVDTYFSFIKEPCQSVLVRYAQYFSNRQKSQDANWELYLTPERRVILPHFGVIPEWASRKFEWTAQKT